MQHSHHSRSIFRKWRALLLALTISALSGLPAIAADDRPGDSAVVRLMSRDVVTLRSPLGDASPAQRAERARERFAQLSDTDLATPARLQPFTLGSASGYAVMVGSSQLFNVLETDIDPLDSKPVQQLAQDVLLRVQAAIDAHQQQRHVPGLLIGAALALLATLVLAAALYGINRLWQRVAERLAQATTRLLEMPAAHAAAGSSLTRQNLGGFALRFLGNVAGLCRWAIMLALVYSWAVFVLERFPFSRPLGEELGALLFGTLAWVGQGAIAAVPDLITLAVILFLTRAAVDVMRQIFDSVQSGQLQLPFMHRETVGATRRIVTVLIWGLGFAFCYPYIPGSSSEAFKGLSVLFGIVISLGSTGVMTQMMSGLVVVYSRALRTGDFVSVNGVEGMVVEVGALATKLINLRNEEITIPNGVLIGNPIHNFSKLSGTQGTLLSTKVTIGYDTPWRQVHAMLIAAAALTDGVRTTPKPVVYQRALNDFYVEYEVVMHVDEPLHRIRILSQMHANIQDQFNEFGVQIMSPHFFDQPAEAVVVPKEKWFAAPAEKG